MTRVNTNKILELIDEGVLDANIVLLAALNYMSDDEVKRFAELNEFLLDDDVSDEDKWL